jgi:hypothetical protein
VHVGEFAVWSRIRFGRRVVADHELLGIIGNLYHFTLHLKLAKNFSPAGEQYLLKAMTSLSQFSVFH